MRSLENVTADDALKAIKIADRVWWVGHYLEDDPFQCHVYLIEHGDQSVLFDPGSKLTFEHTLKKIEQVIPFDNIRYFVCHHQDPDIAAAMPQIDRMITRDDAVLVSHWRAEALLKHYGLDLPFWLVEEHDWQLDLGGRKLKFVFTPYAHFPGAFVTFDEQSGVLFSSDIFGGFTEGFSLVAKDEGYFENLKPFHEHYIPSRDIMRFTINNLRKLPLKMIAPQHGSIIPHHLISFMLDQLSSLECGIYLLSRDNTDFLYLSSLNKALRDITQVMIIYRDFKDIAKALTSVNQKLLPVKSLEFFAKTPDNNILYLEPLTRYRGLTIKTVPENIESILAMDAASWEAKHHRCFTIIDKNQAANEYPSILIPFFSSESGQTKAIAFLHMYGDLEDTSGLDEIIEQMTVPLQVAVEREVIYRTLDMEKQKFYESSIRDPLTGLFTRFYMQDTVSRLLAIHDRDKNAQVAMIMTDIDHFKRVNDTYGHNQGDVVLKRVAAALLETVRAGDVPVRLGGEEFAIFISGESSKSVADAAERLRKLVAELKFDAPMTGISVTASFGVAIRKVGEDLISFIARADNALYEAKETGRNKVCQASE